MPRDIPDAVALGVALDDLGDVWVVRVRHPRKQVVLDLVVEAPDDPTENRVAGAEVDRRLDLMIVDGETGLLVPRGNVEALVAAMRALLADPELRERMGEAARVRAQQFLGDVVLPRIEALYVELTSPGGRLARAGRSPMR